jgi:hypothetical protein
LRIILWLPGLIGTQVPSSTCHCSCSTLGLLFASGEARSSGGGGGGGCGRRSSWSGSGCGPRCCARCAGGSCSSAACAAAAATSCACSVSACGTKGCARCQSARRDRRRGFHGLGQLSDHACLLVDQPRREWQGALLQFLAPRRLPYRCQLPLLARLSRWRLRVRARVSGYRGPRVVCALCVRRFACSARSYARCVSSDASVIC